MKDSERPFVNGHERLSTTLKDSQRLAVIAEDPETRMTTKGRQQHSATGNDYMETRLLLKTIEEMECKFGCHERGNLHANEHRTEAETKSDIQVENLINVAEFKANFMGKLYYY